MYLIHQLLMNNVNRHTRMRISIKLTEAFRDARVTVVTDSGREDGE